MSYGDVGGVIQEQFGVIDTVFAFSILPDIKKLIFETIYDRHLHYLYSRGYRRR